MVINLLLLYIDMKLSVIILAICVLMDSTSGECLSSVNCPDGEFRVAWAINTV